MSTTISRGLTDAARWATVAATVADYLESMDRSRRPKTPTRVPLGAFNAAERFLRIALQGTETDAHTPTTHRGGSPLSAEIEAERRVPMAGISHLSVAVGVLELSERESPVEDLGRVERDIRSLLATLEAVRDTHPTDQRERARLRAFFRELQKQGDAARDAAFDADEQPHDTRTIR